VKWYKNKKLRVHTVAYRNEREASKEANIAAKYGWVPQGTAVTDGHINVARSLLRVAVGVGLIGGPSRTKGRVTITYVRQG